MCRDDDGGCRSGFAVALAGVSCDLLEEDTHAFFAILFWEVSNRLL